MDFFIETVMPMIGTTGVVIAGLSMLNSIIVEVLKKVFTKAPTQLVAWISAMIVTLAFFLLAGNYIDIKSIILTIIQGIFSGFIVALVSTEGYDGLKKLIDRLSIPKK